MGAWDVYKDRLMQIGCPKHDMWVNHTRMSIRRRMMDSPSCRKVEINGAEQYVSIVHTTDMFRKKICALPGESLYHGGLVDFANNKWIITEIDADNDIYERGYMQQCNHILRWISKDGTLKEKWCFVEDGTKYLIGEFSEELMSIGDARIAITIARDEDTIELSRGFRFLIDDTDAENPIAYQITKPNKLFNVFNGRGVFKFILNEVTTTKNDNFELRIADYYNWMPPRATDGDHIDSDDTVEEIVATIRENISESPPSDDKEVWL